MGGPDNLGLDMEKLAEALKGVNDDDLMEKLRDEIANQQEDD